MHHKHMGNNKKLVNFMFTKVSKLLTTQLLDYVPYVKPFSFHTQNLIYTFFYCVYSVSVRNKEEKKYQISMIHE